MDEIQGPDGPAEVTDEMLQAGFDVWSQYDTDNEDINRVLREMYLAMRALEASRSTK